MSLEISNTFYVPESITASGFSSFFNHYNKWKKQLPQHQKNVEINFEKTRFLEPISMIFFASEEDLFTQNGIDVTIKSEPNTRVEKFLRIFGVSKTHDNVIDYYENNVGNYAVKVQKCLSSQDGKNVADNILPKIMNRIECNKNVKAGLNWALYELIDNAGVHGYKCYESLQYPEPVYTCAFSYRDRVEIAVLDRGQGIYNSLKSKGMNLNVRESLIESTKRGVTGHPNGSPGFGLFGSSQLAKKGGGSIHLWSQGYGLSIKNDSEKTFSIPEFQGTMVSLGLSAGSNFALESILTRTADEFFEDFNIEM